jgi:hypothetical protein
VSIEICRTTCQIDLPHVRCCVGIPWIRSNWSWILLAYRRIAVYKQPHAFATFVVSGPLSVCAENEQSALAHLCESIPAIQKWAHDFLGSHGAGVRQLTLCYIGAPLPSLLGRQSAALLSPCRVAACCASGPPPGLKTNALHFVSCRGALLRSTLVWQGS